jgi:hypothetical protein
LSTEKMDKEAATKLFCKEEVILGSDQNKLEREHFMEVIAIAVGRVLASRRPEAKKLLQFLPAHHKHQNSGKKLMPALTFIVKPYPYCETKNPDTIKLLLRIQRQFLEAVAKSRCDDDPEFGKLLSIQ